MRSLPLRSYFFALCAFILTACVSLVAHAASPYQIGVWYFTAWNSAADSVQVRGAQKVYGRRDPWGGVRDYATGHGAFPIVDPQTGKPEDFAGRQPLLGFYDEMSQAVVNAQIRAAASEGINFFAFYYYINTSSGAETSTSAPIAKFFESPDRGLMKFVLAPIAIGQRGSKISRSTWRDVVVPKLIRYLGSDAYFRIDDRPVLIDFTLPFQNVQDRAWAYEQLRKAAQKSFGRNPLILELLGPDAQSHDRVYQERFAHPDGFTCFQFPIASPHESYGDYTARWATSMSGQIGAGRPGQGLTTYVPCGSVGLDARPWYGIGWNGWKGKAGPDSRPYTTGTTPELFRKHLEELKAFMDSEQVNTMNTAILYAWNEWGEAAAAIEPSQQHGYRYADVVREVFGLVPRTAKPDPVAPANARSSTEGAPN